MLTILTKAFWKGLWIWLKANWKFVLGVSIPVLLYLVSRKGNINRVLKLAVAQRDE